MTRCRTTSREVSPAFLPSSGNHWQIHELARRNVKKCFSHVSPLLPTSPESLPRWQADLDWRNGKGVGVRRLSYCSRLYTNFCPEIALSRCSWNPSATPFSPPSITRTGLGLIAPLRSISGSFSNSSIARSRSSCLACSLVSQRASDSHCEKSYGVMKTTIIDLLVESSIYEHIRRSDSWFYIFSKSLTRPHGAQDSSSIADCLRGPNRGCLCTDAVQDIGNTWQFLFDVLDDRRTSIVEYQCCS